MTVSEKTAPGQTEAIAFDFDLKHSPKKVWRALTDPTLLTEWLLPVVGFKLEPGAAFTLQAPPQPGWDGHVSCEFVEIEEHHKLSYTWRVADLDTVVTFTVTPTASGTRLSLVQAGFKSHQKHNFGGARYGWKMMGGRLIDVLAQNA